MSSRIDVGFSKRDKFAYLDEDPVLRNLLDAASRR
jgi:hypothetical protein